MFAMSQLADVADEIKDVCGKNAKIRRERLSILAKTTYSIERCLKASLPELIRSQRLERIFAHVSGLYAYPIDNYEAGRIEEGLADLQGMQQTTIDEIWVGLPDLQNLKREITQLAVSIKDNEDQRRQELAEKLNNLRLEANITLHALQRKNISFIDALKTTKAGERLVGTSRKPEKTMIQLLLRFLRPSPLITGDIYFGFNVGSMGREARTDTVYFNGDTNVGEG